LYASRTADLLGSRGRPALSELLVRPTILLSFDLRDHLESVLKITQKYATVPASLADASLVRMTEVLGDPILLTTDTDFRIYRRHGRQVVPCVLPHRNRH
jgi:hypothetical protein